jgi:ferredoxin-NADP reductase
MSRSIRDRAKQLLDDLGSLAGEQASAQAMRMSGWGADHARSDHAGQARMAVAAIHPKRMELELLERERCSPSTVRLRFARRDGRLPPFRPGQYISLAVLRDGVRTARPYSIASAPGDPLLEILVRDDPEGFVAPYLCHEVQPGWRTTSSGPAGRFFVEPLRDAERLVFVAGGSGITPFMSMLRHEQAQGWPRSITLIYGNRSPDDLPYGAELRSMARANPQLRLALVYSEAPAAKRVRRGFIDRGQILHAVAEPSEHSFFLCGPEPMLALVRAELAALGLPRRRVRSERFGPPGALTEQAGWPQGLSPGRGFQLTVEGGPTIPARAGEPLLVAMERAGLTPSHVCRTGGCGRCRVKLLAGEVFVPATVALRQSDREHGFVYACMAWPLGDCSVGGVP